MRIHLATLVALIVISFCPAAWSQSADPFGRGAGPNRPNPFGGPPAKLNAPAQLKTPAQFATPARRPAAAGAVIRSAQPTAQSAKTIAQRRAAGQPEVVLMDLRANPFGGPPRVKQLDTEQKIHVALDSKTTQSFIETPLSEAIRAIGDAHEIPIVIDSRALEEIGLDADVGVNIDLKNISLRSFLRLMLRDLDMTYVVKDEVMQITTTEAAEDNLAVEMYILPENLVEKSDQVIEVLTATVVPDTWKPTGGPSTAMAIDQVLVVSTTCDVHEDVKKFLAMLSEKYGK